MRMGFKGSTTRLAVVVALVLLALCVVAVPLASAAPTVPCLVFGSVQGHFYGGNLALPAEVAVFDPGNANLGETKTSGALFELVVDVPLPLYAATLKVDTETLGPKALDSTKADWTSFFTKNPQSSVEYMYNTSGDFAYSSAVPLVLQVKVTTLIGAVTVLASLFTSVMSNAKPQLDAEPVAAADKPKTPLTG